ncbi:MAG: choice-of-anchor Q domain-containing protein [Phycisphaerae bacterium]
MKTKNFLFIFSSWFIIIACQKTLAVTYYVSPSGNYSHSGTSAQTAWQTIDKVNTVDLNPGDKVLFEGGHDYPGNLLLTTEDAGTPVQPVVIGSYGSGRATIKAGNGSGVTVLNAGGVVVENLIVMGDDYRTNVGSGVKIVNELPNNKKLEYIRVHNVEAAGFGRKKIYAMESQPTNGCGIFVGGYASDKSESGYNDVRITNCVTHQNEYFGILTSGYWHEDSDTYANSNVYVGYCKLYDNPGDPNYFENHSGSGILMEDVDGGIIEYCEAYNNGYKGGCKVGGPIGIWAAVANNVIIQFCESHHNRAGKGDGGGFDFDGGTTSSILQYNYSHDNDGAGYLICSYENAPHTFKNNIVRYCISVNDARKERHAAINLWTGSPKDDPIHNTQIYGNIIYSSISPAISIRTKGIYNTKVCNNLFITANNQKLMEVTLDKSMATFAGNVYWAVDGAFDIAGYKSLEAWRAATGQEMLNGKPVGLVVDPMLMGLGKSITIGDPTKLHTLTAYRLRKNSPLIDAGLDLRSLFGIDPGKRDFYGTSIPQGKGCDIGAHEFILENHLRAEQK